MSDLDDELRAADRRERFALPYDVLPLADGYAAAWCVDPDGSTSLWVISPHGADPGRHSERGCSCRSCAPHERLGALPDEYRPRGGFRCTAIAATTGRRCRNGSRTPDGLCRVHSDWRPSTSSAPEQGRLL